MVHVFTIIFRVLLIAALLQSCSSGCVTGGQPNPQGYSCGDYSRAHCYATVSFGQGCKGNPPLHECLYGYQTQIYTTHDIYGGHGFIDNEFWLQSFDTGGWIEAGYISDPLILYFWAENQPSGYFIAHYLSQVPEEDFDNYGTYDIHTIGNNLFRVSITNKTTNYQADVSNTMWSATDHGSVDLGQELAGTVDSSGGSAYAGVVFFQFNSWYDEAGNRHYETFDDPPLSEDPPYGDWFLFWKPSATKDGGAFFTECCLPPEWHSPFEK